MMQLAYSTSIVFPRNKANPMFQIWSLAGFPGTTGEPELFECALVCRVYHGRHAGNWQVGKEYLFVCER